MSAKPSRAIYAGSFDPFTLGHLDIVKKGIDVFDEVVVLIGKSPTKNPLFSFDEREEMLKELFQNELSVTVDSWDGLIVEYAKKHQATHLIRGLRPIGDFEKEFQMASMNKMLLARLKLFSFPLTLNIIIYPHL